MALNSIYIRLRHKFVVKMDENVTVGKTAQIVATEDVKKKLSEVVIHHVTPEDQSTIVIDVMRVISVIYQYYPEADIQTIGPSQTILEVQYKKRLFRPLFFGLVWVLLFIGSGLAIMNFHEDVSMGTVHQKIYYLVTGHFKEKPLMLQIPYSLGLGVGMVLFFNHLFKKQFNEEPSPLEVEMFNYQQDLDRYVIMNENKKNESKLDGD